MSIINRIKFPFYLSLTLLSGWSAQVQAETVVTVGIAPHGGQVILGGTVIPLKEVTLAAQIPGRIVSIAGEEGDEFATGIVLVSINDDNLQAKKAAAEAQVTSAQNAMQNAQVQYNRELWNPRVYNPRPMAGMGMPSMFDGFFNNMDDMPGSSTGNKSIERHADLVTQGTQVASARSAVTSADSNLRAINAKLRDTKAIAPFDGVIMKKMVEIGDTVQPGQPLIIFSYSKYLRIQVEVPAQHTVTVKFDLPEGVPGGPGMYAEVTIPDVNASEQALPVIPKSAISQRGSLPSVRVLDENNVPKMRLIRTGIDIGENSIVVLSGLKPGEKIVISTGK